MAKIKIEVSARHLHLSAKDLAKLFGKGYKLKPIKKLSQPKEFSSSETVAVKTAAGQLDNVRILGPIRKETQVELTMTDARKLKINPPIKLSGDLVGSSGVILIGSKGQVALKKGVIIAKRHIHCSSKQAKALGLKNDQNVSVKTAGDRSVTFNNVSVRVSPDFDLSMHIDTDEGNASLPGGVCAYGEIIM